MAALFEKIGKDAIIDGFGSGALVYLVYRYTGRTGSGTDQAFLFGNPVSYPTFMGITTGVSRLGAVLLEDVIDNFQPSNVTFQAVEKLVLGDLGGAVLVGGVVYLGKNMPNYVVDLSRFPQADTITDAGLSFAGSSAARSINTAVSPFFK